MDWSKTKTRLILILLVLNICLGILYVVNRNNQNPDLASKETLVELENRLNKFGIKLNAKIPKSPTSIKPLIVKYKEEFPDEINYRFFDGKGRVEQGEDISRVSLGDEEISIINNRRLLYENTNSQKTKENISPEKLAMEFISDKGFNTEDLILVKVTTNGEVETFEFTKKYNKKLVETSYTRVSIKNGAVVTMDRLWIEVIEEDTRNIDIEPSHKALFSLLGREEYEGETIKSIELCYYFNPEEQGILEDNTRAERGRAIPGWRIGFESGESLIVDNY